MGERDWSKLTKALIITDMYDTGEDPITLSGVAIPAERTEEFLEAVEKLAVEQFEGATFVELLDHDDEDEAMRAASKQYFREQSDAMMRAVHDILESSASKDE